MDIVWCLNFTDKMDALSRKVVDEISNAPTADEIDDVEIKRRARLLADQYLSC